MRKIAGYLLWLVDEALDRIPSWSPAYGWQRYGDHGCRLNMIGVWEPWLNGEKEWSNL